MAVLPDAGAEDLAAAARDTVALASFRRGTTTVAAMIASWWPCATSLSSSAARWPTPARCCSTHLRAAMAPGWISSAVCA